MHTTKNISEQPQSLPPRTAGFPLIGSVPNLLSKQTDFLLDSWQTHGDIYELDLGLLSIVMLNHPDHAQYILRDNFRNYSKGGEMWDSVRQVIGDGLVTSEGDFWRRQRRMIQPQFHRQHLAGLTNHMIDAIEEGMNDWDAIADSGEAFDISKAFGNITMKVIVRAMFGHSLNENDAAKMADAMGYSLEYMIKNMVLGKFPNWMPVPGRKQFHDAIAQSDNFIYNLIEQRRHDTDKGNDLLAMLLNLVDEETGEPMSDKEIRDEVATVFLAGYETTAVAMTWASDLLLQNQSIVEKLVESVQTAIETRRPIFEDIPNLAYSQMIMQESMRLLPPVFWLPRTVVEDDVIDGYTIKAGQMVAVVPLAIHRHPDFWEDALNFNPERFSQEASKHRHAMAYMPFGAGQRLCIGKDFALLEGTLILSILAQKYELEAVRGREAKPALSTTLTTKDGLWVRLNKRNH